MTCDLQVVLIGGKPISQRLQAGVRHSGAACAAVKHYITTPAWTGSAREGRQGQELVGFALKLAVRRSTRPEAVGGKDSDEVVRLGVKVDLG